MGKKQTLNSLPEGDYSVDGGGKVLKSLPEGDYSMGVQETEAAFNPSDWMTQPKQDIEPIIEELARTSRGGLMDSEKEALRQMLTNPNLTGEQAKRGIAAIQGYDPKQSEDNTMYYLKQEDNGVLVPQALGSKERPPQGYNIPSVWGSQEDANDDSWYTDALKSLYNAAPGLVGSFADLGQLAYKGITGETSESLNKVKYATEAFKMTKDEDLNKQIYDTEGVKKWEDLVSSERFDFGPEAIWGTLNSALESVPQFFLGAGVASEVAKGITGAEKLTKGAAAASAFTGSFLTMLGDNMDAAEEAGLQGRDVAKFAMTTTAAQASIDAAIGLPSKILMNSVRQSEKELMKGIAKTIQKDANGLITEEGFKQLAREVPVAYSQMIKVGAKEILKDAGKEMAQETSQDIIEKSAKQLWDKMSDEDKGRFGVDALSPQSFASYFNSGIAGFITGAPMAVVSTNYKKKYQEQSKELFDRIKAGPEAVNELKANLGVARDKGQLSEEEYNQAIFKVDAYKVYNDQVADQDLSDQEKKEAFELSFNIEALKSEIPTKKEDIEGLDPIGQAKIAAKKELMNGLQKQLNEIIQKKENEKETKVAEETKTKTEPEEKKGVDELLKKYGKTEKGAKVVDENTINKAIKKPRAKRSETDNVKWAGLTAQEQKQILQEEAKETPNNEIGITLVEGQNETIIGVLDDGKRVSFAQSVNRPNAKTPNYFNRAALPEEDPDGFIDESGQKLKKYKGTVPIKRVEIDAFELDENDNEVEAFDSDGNRKRKAVLVAYNPKSGDALGFVRENSPVNGVFYANTKNYTETEKKELNKLNKLNYLSDEITPYLYRPKPEGTSEKAKEPKKSDAQEVGQGGQDNVREEGAETGVQRKLTPREKELKAAAKPKIELEYVANQDALVKDVKVEVSNSEGTTDTVELPLKDVQKNIRKTMSLLKQVLDCVHG